MIAELAHKYNAIFHTDAVQAFGHIQIDVSDLDIDLLSASGHKIGCPKGCGFLYIKNDVHIDPLIYGSQMDSMRGGTENVAFIVGMAKAVDLINNDQMHNLKTTILSNNFISELKAIGCTLNGSFENRLPNNINVTFNQNVTGESLIYMLDMSDIMVSAGSACNSHSTEVSYVLKAIGLSDEEAMKTLRITLPDNITGDDLDNVICEIKKQITLLTI
jgi:cysteine desulfurase